MIGTMDKRVDFLVIACFLASVSSGSPVKKVVDAELELKAIVINLEVKATVNCIETAWGCINLSDPFLRPKDVSTSRADAVELLRNRRGRRPYRDRENQEAQAEEDEDVKLDVVTEDYPMPDDGKLDSSDDADDCIPTSWGCIDLTDPSLRP